jgi:nucleolar protein 53
MVRTSDSTNQSISKRQRRGAQKLSRKKKRYWRRGTNFEEAEKDVATSDTQKRISSAIASQDSSELFAIDNSPFSKTRPRSMGVNGTLQLKCFSNLESDPLIAPAKVSKSQKFKKPIKKRLRMRGKLIKRPRHQQLEQVRRRSGTSSDTNQKVLASVEGEETVVESGNQGAAGSGNSGISNGIGMYDLWRETPTLLPDASKMDVDCVSEETLRHLATRGSGRAIKPPKMFGAKPSVLDAVDVAHPGASYNPSLSDYRELLSMAAEDERVKLNAEQRIERQISLPRREDCATMSTYMAEMCEGLFVDDDNNDRDNDGHGRNRTESNAEGAEPSDSSDEDAYHPPNAPVSRDKKKSRQQRKRELEEQLRKAHVTAQKAEKQKLNDVFSIRRLMGEIEEESAVSARRVENRIIRKLLRTTHGPGRLSKHRYTAPDKEILLPEELQGSLRLLKTEGNILEDRCKSLQKRNMLETRIRQKRKRKYKKKTYETRSHKAVTLDYKII